MTDLTPTDFRALCAELLEIFEKYDDESNLGGIVWDMKTDGSDLLDRARAARRPKPLSLKEQALKDLTVMTTVPPGMDPLSPETTERISRIRRALEALPDD